MLRSIWGQTYHTIFKTPAVKSQTKLSYSRQLITASLINSFWNSSSSDPKQINTFITPIPQVLERGVRTRKGGKNKVPFRKRREGKLKGRKDDHKKVTSLSFFEAVRGSKLSLVAA